MLATRERIDKSIANSFVGYGGSLSGLNHTIGLTGFPFAATARPAKDEATRQREEAEAERKRLEAVGTGGGAAEEVSDSEDEGERRAAKPASSVAGSAQLGAEGGFVVTAEQPAFEVTVDIERSLKAVSRPISREQAARPLTPQ